MKHNIIYHNKDLDGFCSGAITKSGLMITGIKEDQINMIGWDYGDLIPKFNPKESYYMVDISLPEEWMIKANEHSNLIWIDHHVSAIEKSIKLGYNNIRGLRRVGDSASLLAWYWFHGLSTPEVVYWVDRFDVWKKEDERFPKKTWDEVMVYQSGMKHHLRDPKDVTEYNKWSASFSVLPDFIKNHGSLICDFIKGQNEIISNRAFELEFEGLKFLVLNQGEINSEAFRSKAKENHDALMAFEFEKEVWKVSMYGNEKDHDLSLIATKYGGGGHKNACGFSIDNINEILKRKN